MTEDIIQIHESVTYEELSMNDLYVGKNQQRKAVDDKDLVDLANSIKKVGLIQPIIVWDDGKGTYEILAGQSRYAAHELYIKEKTTIMCGIVSKRYDSTQCKLISWHENMTRSQPSQQDCIDMCTEIYKIYGSEEAVVSKTGLKKSDVTKYVKFDRLPKEMRDLVNAKDLNLDDALKSWDLSSEIHSENKGEAIEKAIKYSIEFGGITSQQEKNAVLKVAKTNKVSPKKARPMAKKLEKIKIDMVFLPHEAAALNNYANAEGKPQAMAAKDIVTEALENTGYLVEDENE